MTSKKEVSKLRIYKGYRIQNQIGGLVEVHDSEGNFEKLPVNESLYQGDDGFEWGYGGAGPRQLAFSLLYDVTQNSVLAARNAQDFKWDVLARIPMEDDWKLTTEEIVKWVIENSKETNPSPDLL